MSELKKEIAQERPFSSKAEEALLNLMRTADCLQRAMQRTCRRWQVTATQYNVLRILRGAHPQGVTCSSIGERMITAEPDITRLLGRLKALKFVRQQRDKQDRRIVWTHITPAGLTLLAEMDGTVQQFPKEMFAHLSEEDLGTFIGLLERARRPCLNPNGSLSCEGSEGDDGCPGSETSPKEN